MKRMCVGVFFFFVVFGCRWLCYRDFLVGKKGKVPTLKHATREVSHNRLGLDMEVPKHLVASPSSKPSLLCETFTWQFQGGIFTLLPNQEVPIT